METSKITIRKWLVNNSYNDIAGLINEVMDEWQKLELNLLTMMTPFLSHLYSLLSRKFLMVSLSISYSSVNFLCLSEQTSMLLI